jgi:hypothetical protein
MTRVRWGSKGITSEMPEAVRIKLLGGFSVSVGYRTVDQNAWRLKKAAALVKLLALTPSHRLHREQAMDILWPDSGKKAASNNLRKTLHAARKILDPSAGSRYLASEDESLALCPTSDLWVDVEAFEVAAAAAARRKRAIVLSEQPLQSRRARAGGNIPCRRVHRPTWPFSPVPVVPGKDSARYGVTMTDVSRPSHGTMEAPYR